MSKFSSHRRKASKSQSERIEYDVAPLGGATGAVSATWNVWGTASPGTSISVLFLHRRRENTSQNLLINFFSTCAPGNANEAITLGLMEFHYMWERFSKTVSFFAGSDFKNILFSDRIGIPYCGERRKYKISRQSPRCKSYSIEWLSDCRSNSAFRVNVEKWPFTLYRVAQKLPPDLK